MTEYYLPPVGSSGFPRATLLVNIIGTFVLGVVWHASADARVVVGTGFCGALTTFGGFAAQTMDLLQLGRLNVDGSTRTAVVYALGSLVGCAVAAWLGLITALNIWPGV